MIENRAKVGLWRVLRQRDKEDEKLAGTRNYAVFHCLRIPGKKKKNMPYIMPVTQYFN